MTGVDMRGGTAYAVLAVALAVRLVSGLPALAAAGERVVAYGADLTPAEQQELSQVFGVDAAASTATVTTQELVSALQGSGLPVSPTDQAISSAALTCGSPGEVLTVRTQHLTRIPTVAYADAVITAGVSGGQLMIAAPSTNPVTGETALVGVFKAVALCPGAHPLDPTRLRLAYEQVGRTLALAGPGGDLTVAANVLRQAAQPVITRQAWDDMAIGVALDAAAAGQGVQLDPAQRGETISWLKKLGGWDYGAYARGYQLQQTRLNEVRAIPLGATPPGPSSPPAATAPPTAVPDPARRERPASAIWEESMDTLRAAFAASVPRVIGALALGLAGLVLATGAGGATTVVLRRLRFDEVCARVGVTGLLRAGNLRRRPTWFIGALVFWAVLLVTLLAVLGPLGLGFLAQTLNGLVLFVPRVLLAVLLLVLGAAVAGWASEGTARVLGGVGVTRVGGLRTVVRFGLLFIAAVLAAAILGINVIVLVAVAVIGLSALALTAALAVGLGLRGLAHHIAAGRYVAEGIAAGDRISVNGISGTVEQIGHAQTVLRRPDGRVYLVPNGYFLEHIVEKEEQQEGQEPVSARQHDR